MLKFPTVQEHISQNLHNLVYTQQNIVIFTGTFQWENICMLSAKDTALSPSLGTLKQGFCDLKILFVKLVGGRRCVGRKESYQNLLTFFLSIRMVSGWDKVSLCRPQVLACYTQSALSVLISHTYPSQLNMFPIIRLMRIVQKTNSSCNQHHHSQHSNFKNTCRRGMNWNVTFLDLVCILKLNVGI